MAERSADENLLAIWRVVRRIPRGSVATYGDIAERAGDGFTARQVGRALRLAPPGLRLPWHRVLAAGGRIALPADAGLEQRLRLQGEGVTFSGRRARIGRHRWREGREPLTPALDPESQP